MAGLRRAIELAIGEEDLARAIARSPSEPASRVERARMLLAYRNPSFFAVGRALGVHHQTVQRCVERALAYGPMAALDDRPRPGKEPTITGEARHGWSLWPAARRRTWAIPTNCGRRGFWLVTRASMEQPRARLPWQAGSGHVVQDPQEQEVKPHKVRYYLERRDPEFKAKMAKSVRLPRGQDHQRDRAASKRSRASGGDRLL